VRGSANRFDVIDHILTEWAVGEQEGIPAGTGRRTDWAGHVGVDGNDAVAGTEGFHDRWWVGEVGGA
jgi:hypothetical protein